MPRTVRLDRVISGIWSHRTSNFPFQTGSHMYPTLNLLCRGSWITKFSCFYLVLRQGMYYHAGFISYWRWIPGSHECQESTLYQLSSSSRAYYICCHWDIPEGLSNLLSEQSCVNSKKTVICIREKSPIPKPVCQPWSQTLIKCMYKLSDLWYFVMAHQVDIQFQQKSQGLTWLKGSWEVATGRQKYWNKDGPGKWVNLQIRYLQFITVEMK